MTTLSVRAALALVTFTFIATSAFAQATRTWVSGVGDDVNPCSRTAPCQSFAGAIAKTAARGEINVIDPGDYGAVTITKSITINGVGQGAQIIATGSNGITISAAATDVVKLLHLQINGLATSLVGIRFNSGAALIVDDVFVHGFVSGIEAYAGNTTVDHSLIALNSAVGINVLGGTLILSNSTLTGNNVAAQATGTATLRLSNNGLYDNASGLGCGGGTLVSAGNNRKAGNPGGAICAPTAAMTVF
jgi:hypothetical protein